MSDLITTAFHEVQASRGATFMEEGGWSWTASFGDADKEYRAVREGVGMWDVSPLNKWELRGPDALEAAQRVHSNDVLRMDVGQVRYGAILDEEGLLVDDGTVFKLADDLVWVMTNGMDREEYFAEATKGLDVSVEYVARTLPNMQIQGPGSRELLRSITDADVDALRYFRFLPEPVMVGGVPVWLARTGFSGELGFELFLRPEHADALWEAVEAAGATPYGVEVIEPLRIESGHDRHRLRLRLARTLAVRPRAWIASWRSKRRVSSWGRIGCGRSPRIPQPVQDAPTSRRHAARVRRRRHEGRRTGRGHDEPRDQPVVRTDRLSDPSDRRGG